MKISRLYLKIFLAFMLVLIISELVVFVFLQMSWAQSPRVNHMEQQVMMVKNLSEMQLGTKHISAEYERETLTPLLKTLGKSLHAKIWITGPYGETIASSDTVIPNMSDYTTKGETAKSHKNVYIYKKECRLKKCIWCLYRQSS